MATVAAILDFRSELFFFFYVTLILPTESIGLSVQEKTRKIDVYDGVHGGHLGFAIRTILAIFYLQVNRPFVSGEEGKTRFSRWPSLISIRNDFIYFWSTSHADVSLPSLMSAGFSLQETKRKINFQGDGHGGHPEFPIGTILAFWSTSHPDVSYQV